MKYKIQVHKYCINAVVMKLLKWNQTVLIIC